jgi:hypothetical protein
MLVRSTDVCRCVGGSGWGGLEREAGERGLGAK